MRIVRRSMDRLVDGVLTIRRPGREMTPLGWEPMVEMFETDTAVVVRAG